MTRRACIDIGSNTTRLLVADCAAATLREVHQERAFTRVGRALSGNGTIADTKIAEVALVVARQLSVANELGASDVRVVATASVRRASNGHALVQAVAESCGHEVWVLSEQEEARLAFIGAARTLDHAPAGELGVIDVGGGSTELAIGLVPDRVLWSASLPIGSGVIADHFFGSDPPAAAELRRARTQISEVLATVDVPCPREAVAVGGSATSLRSLAGARLDADAVARAMELLTRAPAVELARATGLDAQRIRLLPAGLLILEVVAERFGTAPAVGSGGIREGVLLEAEAAAHQ